MARGLSAASEPSIDEYLGIDGRGEEPSDEEYAHWQEFCARCRARGWHEADPQPSVFDDAWLSGSVCQGRCYHDLTCVDGHWTVCVDCGYTLDDEAARGTSE